MKKLIFIILIAQSLISFSQEQVIIHLDKENIKTSDIYFKVDTMPDLICDYEGDYMTKIKAFVSRNIQWPNSEIDCTGKVYVQFIVETDGSISNINIVRGLDSCDGFNEEALRVINLMDKWIPGIKNGEPVRIQMTVPVKFILE